MGSQVSDWRRSTEVPIEYRGHDLIADRVFFALPEDLLEALDAAVVQALAFSEDGSFLASGGGDSAITVWKVDRANQKAKEMGVLRGHSGPIRDLKFSADGQTLFSAGGERTIRVWDVAKSTERAILRGHRIPASKLVLSSGENVLLSLSFNWEGGPEFRVWRAPTPGQGSLP